MGSPLDKVKGRKSATTATSLDINRIIRLPITEMPTEEEVEAISRMEVDARYFDEGFRLLRPQAAAFAEYEMVEGLIGNIGVGWGKTLTSTAVPDRAFKRGELERVALFVPSEVYTQLVRHDIAQIRKWCNVTMPFIYMGGLGAKDRMMKARSGKRGCYVMPYSQLSTRDAEELLFTINPDLVVLDEAHKVKNPNSARTRRLRRFLTERQPKVMALSGTLTTKSINDYHHLAAHALGDQCPLPLDPTLASNWSMVLDANADPDPAQTGPLQPLVDWARANFPKEDIPEGIPGFRAAYKLRLNSVPGVVSTGDAEIGVSLILENTPVPDYKGAHGFDEVARLMKQVEDLFVSPSGDEIEHGFHKWRYLYELTAGFYYNLRWPEIEELVAKGRSEPEAHDALERAMEHHEARQEYHRKLRRFLQYEGRPGLDTPLLVGSDMLHHGDQNVGAELYHLWTHARELEFENMPERISEPVYLSDYKVDHAVRWAQDTGRGLIWYHHNAVGARLAQRLQEAGLDPIHCPSESTRAGSNDRILDPANADRVIVASMNGHGTGKNLQHFQDQWFQQFPRKADLLEQVLGRLHRNGQKADELIAKTCNTTDFDHANMAAALVDALYIHQTLGARQKAIFATYNPLPRIFPDDFLRERGFTDMRHLDGEARRKLEEKFGALERLK